MKNTVFPHHMLEKFSEHYQAHLERISDYILLGPGVWWSELPEGMMVLVNETTKGLALLYRISNLHRVLTLRLTYSKSGKLAAVQGSNYLLHV